MLISGIFNISHYSHLKLDHALYYSILSQHLKQCNAKQSCNMQQLIPTTSTLIDKENYSIIIIIDDFFKSGSLQVITGRGSESIFWPACLPM